MSAPSRSRPRAVQLALVGPDTPLSEWQAETSVTGLPLPTREIDGQLVLFEADPVGGPGTEPARAA